MREASNQESGAISSHVGLANHSQVFNMMSARSTMSTISDSQPITRSSLAVLTGDDNDLLSESPVFQQAKGVGAEMMTRPVSEVINSRSIMPEVAEANLDEHLVNEINDYLTGIMEDNSHVIEMSDSPIKS